MRKVARTIMEVFHAFAEGKNLRSQRRYRTVYYESIIIEGERQFHYMDRHVATIKDNVLKIHPQGSFSCTQLGGTLGQLVHTCLSKIHGLPSDDYRWRLGSLGGLFFTNYGYRFGGWRTPENNFPLEIDIVNRKILTQIDEERHIRALIYGRSLYTLANILGACKFLGINISEKTKVRVTKQALKHLSDITSAIKVLGYFEKKFFLKHVQQLNKTLLDFIHSCKFEWEIERLEENKGKIIGMGIDPSILEEIPGALLKIELDKYIKKAA